MTKVIVISQCQRCFHVALEIGIILSFFKEEGKTKNWKASASGFCTGLKVVIYIHSESTDLLDRGRSFIIILAV